MNRVLNVLCALLGGVSLASTLWLGVYVTALCWSLLDLGGQFLPMAVASWMLTLTSTLLLGYGSLNVLRGRWVGGILNLVAGCINFAFFWYFYYYFPVLPQFGPYSTLQFAPALLSALITLTPKLAKRLQPS